MPYKCEKIKMPNGLKRSYKLTEQDKEDIRYIRANSSLGLSQNDPKDFE